MHLERIIVLQLLGTCTCVSIRSILLHMPFKSSVSLPIFLFFSLILPVTNRGVLKYLITFMELSISSVSYFSFCCIGGYVMRPPECRSLTIFASVLLLVWKTGFSEVFTPIISKVLPLSPYFDFLEWCEVSEYQKNLDNKDVWHSFISYFIQ